MTAGRQWYYILKGRAVVPATREEWSDFYPGPERIVAQTMIGTVRVSTVFLGIDHSFTLEGPPIVFETMIFADDDWAGIDQWRYATYDEAEQGHKVACSIAEQIVAEATAGISS